MHSLVLVRAACVCVFFASIFVLAPGVSAAGSLDEVQRCLSPRR